jgi:hypothetical protein
MGLQQPINRRFRYEVALSIGDPSWSLRWLPGRCFQGTLIPQHAPLESDYIPASLVEQPGGPPVAVAARTGPAGQEGW